MAARRKAVLEKMEAAVTAARPRSPLAVWLEENRVGFAALLARHGARWGALAAVLAEEGLTDVDGRTPQAETLRGAWRRVLKRQEKIASNRTPKPQASPPRPAPPPAQAPSPVSSPASRDETAVDQPTSRAQEQIDRLSRHFASRKGKLPDTM